MAGNARENSDKKGFWDGGSRSYGNGKESAGRASGFPGQRKPKTLGVRTDLEKAYQAPPDPDHPRSE